MGSQDAGVVGEDLLVQGDGFIEPARVAIGAGEVVACGEGVGVIRTQEVARLSDRLGERKSKLRHPKIGCIAQRRRKN